MKPVAIIGAGITGLTAAFYLKRAGVPVIVYESGERAGGVIHSLRRDGFLAESGPNTILETSPKIARLIGDAGLAARRLDTSPDADARFVVRGRQAVAMPPSQLGIFTSKLLSARAKLALLREPFIAARRDGVEESVAQFVTRRLDQEFLDRMVDALVAGIYAGDPFKLSIRHALPRLAQLEEKYGSLIKGQFFGARERKRTGEAARSRAPKFSFDEGLQVLPDTLAAQLGDALKLNTPVTGLSPTDQGWEVTTSGGGSEHGAVIYCGTAFKLAELRTGGMSGFPRRAPDFSSFSEIRYPPVASVLLGFRREDVAHACQGFGMLIPRLEGFKILGTIFSSALFPNRAPAGHVLLTSYVGGERQPELASLPADQLVSLVCEDLGVLLGVGGRPKFIHTYFNPRAIPQYNVGYGRYKELLADIEARSRGLFFAGCYRDGVSLGDSIVAGVNMAERVSKSL